MKLKLLIFGAFLVLSSSAVFGQTGKEVAAIRAKVAAINKAAPRYTKVTKSVEDISLEGAEATFFSTKKILKKTTARMYGETYRATGEFYFDGEKPVFAFIKHYQYDTQIGMGKAPKVVKTEERRFYFKDGELIRLLVGKKELRADAENYGELKQSAEEIAGKLLEAFRR